MFFQDLYSKIKYGDALVLVSGLPRSGTSMAMKMLEAGGMDVIQDGVRTADIDNPKGYYEDERIKSLGEMQDKSWLRDIRGRVIKVVSSLLQYLPPENRYKVIFMRRNLTEVLASQAKMLERRGETHDAADEEMKKMYRQHLEKVAFQLRFRKNFDVIYLDYKETLENPRLAAEEIAKFLGRSMDLDAMAAVVDPNLYRNRSS